jgi:hypothetical protein
VQNAEIFTVFSGADFLEKIKAAFQTARQKLTFATSGAQME